MKWDLAAWTIDPSWAPFFPTTVKHACFYEAWDKTQFDFLITSSLCESKWMWHRFWKITMYMQNPNWLLCHIFAFSLNFSSSHLLLSFEDFQCRRFCLENTNQRKHGVFKMKICRCWHLMTSDWSFLSYQLEVKYLIISSDSTGESRQT